MTPSSVTLQVLPFSAGAHAGMDGEFTIFGYRAPEDPDVVYIENTGGDAYIEDADVTRRYNRIFDHLRAAALDPAEQGSRASQAKGADDLGERGRLVRQAPGEQAEHGHAQRIDVGLLVQGLEAQLRLLHHRLLAHQGEELLRRTRKEQMRKVFGGNRGALAVVTHDGVLGFRPEDPPRLEEVSATHDVTRKHQRAVIRLVNSLVAARGNHNA